MEGKKRSQPEEGGGKRKVLRICSDERDQRIHLAIRCHTDNETFVQIYNRALELLREFPIIHPDEHPARSICTEIAIGPRGRIYISGLYNERLLVMDSRTGEIRRVDFGPHRGSLGTVRYNATNGKLYLRMPDENEMFVIDPHTEQIERRLPLKRGLDFAIDHSSNGGYVQYTMTKVKMVDDGGHETVLSLRKNIIITSMGVLSNGNVVVIDGVANAVHVMTRDLESLYRIDGTSGLMDVAVDAENAVAYVIDSEKGKLYALDGEKEVDDIHTLIDTQALRTVNTNASCYRVSVAPPRRWTDWSPRTHGACFREERVAAHNIIAAWYMAPATSAIRLLPRDIVLSTLAQFAINEMD